MKAWHTFINDETGEDAIHCIVFAETRSKAKYASEAYGETHWTNISALRKPQFDQYAELGYVPREAMISDGWVFECDQCSSSLSASNFKDGFVLCDHCFESTESPSEASAV